MKAFEKKIVGLMSLFLVISLVVPNMGWAKTQTTSTPDQRNVPVIPVGRNVQPTPKPVTSSKTPVTSNTLAPSPLSPVSKTSAPPALRPVTPTPVVRTPAPNPQVSTAPMAEEIPIPTNARVIYDGLPVNIFMNVNSTSLRFQVVGGGSIGTYPGNLNTNLIQVDGQPLATTMKLIGIFLTNLPPQPPTGWIRFWIMQGGQIRTIDFLGVPIPPVPPQ